MKYVLS